MNEKEPNEILLSVIIPTKNRQYTALYAIESVLRIGNANIELIVHDCSDTSILESQIQQKFGINHKVKYFYVDEPLSMTDNWNLAISKTVGKYICGIGDDDAVLPGIVMVVNWMQQHDVDACLPPWVTYIWEDAYVGSYSNGRISFSKWMDGTIYKVALNNEFEKTVRSCGFGYTENLPNVYHGIIKKRILCEHKKFSGNYLSGSALDVYSAIALSKYTKNLYYVNYPFTIRGACGASNTNRIATNAMKAHFDEIKNLNVIESLPQLLSSEVSIAESSIAALVDTGQVDLVAKMNLAILYGKCASLNPTLWRKLYKRHSKYKREGSTDFDFIRFTYIFLCDRIKSGLRNSMVTLFYRFFPRTCEYLVSKLMQSNFKIRAGNITDASLTLLKVINMQQLSLGSERAIKNVVVRRNIWE